MPANTMRALRYLSFEIGRECDMAHLHHKCPSGHCERYCFGSNAVRLTDEIIIDFWK